MYESFVNALQAELAIITYATREYRSNENGIFPNTKRSNSQLLPLKVPIRKGTSHEVQTK